MFYILKQSQNNYPGHCFVVNILQNSLCSKRIHRSIHQCIQLSCSCIHRSCIFVYILERFHSGLHLILSSSYLMVELLYIYVVHLQDCLLSCQLRIMLHIPSGYGGNVVHRASGSKWYRSLILANELGRNWPGMKPPITGRASANQRPSCH